jgi:hypothetical protein
MIKTDVQGNRDDGLSEKKCLSCNGTWIVAHHIAACQCGGELTTIRNNVTTNELRRQLMGMLKKS